MSKCLILYAAVVTSLFIYNVDAQVECKHDLENTLKSELNTLKRYPDSGDDVPGLHEKKIDLLKRRVDELMNSGAIQTCRYYKDKILEIRIEECKLAIAMYRDELQRTNRSDIREKLKNEQSKLKAFEELYY